MTKKILFTLALLSLQASVTFVMATGDCPEEAACEGSQGIYGCNQDGGWVKGNTCSSGCYSNALCTQCVEECRSETKKIKR